MPATPPLHVLKASAGSGKTFALTVHYISLLLRNEHSYREILALTFTNKATAEMKSRIMTILEGLAKSTESRSIRDYREQLLKRFPNWEPVDIQQRADRAYRNILHDYSHFSVSTIDGFSQKVIRGFAYELDLDGLYSIELNTDKVQQDLIKRLYLHLNENNALFDWVINRILHNIDRDKSWNIDRELYNLSYIIFSEDFQALDHQISKMDAQELFTSLASYNQSTLSDFQSQYEQYIEQITQIYTQSGVTTDDLARKSQNFLTKFTNCRKAYEKLDELKNVRTKAHDFSGDIERYQSESRRGANVDRLYHSLNPTMEAFSKFLDEHMPHYLLVQAVEGNIYFLRLMKQMSAELANWRVDNNAQLISDAQLLLQKIGLSDQGDPTFIWEKIGNRYRYFLFDEFQDTSANQWRNLFPLLSNALAQSTGEYPEHLIVGDIKQSIYRWRNGDWRILLDGIYADIRRTFHISDTKPWVYDNNLLVNFRSQKHIVEFNNFVTAHLPPLMQSLVNDRIRIELGEDGYHAVWQNSTLDTAIVRAYDGAQQAVAPHNQLIDGGNIDIEYISKKSTEDGEERSLSVSEILQISAERCYDRVSEWISSGAYQPRDIGILVRRNSEARLLIDYFEFRKRGGDIGFQAISGDALLLANNTAIKTLIDTFRFMQYEDSDHAIYLANMVFYYTRSTGQTITQDQWFAIQHADISLLAGALPLALIDCWASLKQLPLAELAEQLITLYRFGETPDNLPALLAFRDMVSRFTNSGDTGLFGFLTFWDEEHDRAAIPASDRTNAVEIITIHKSKGLEYPAVVIPFCNWSLDGKWANQVWFNMQGTPYEHLKTIPIRYSKQVQNSTLSSQYYEEMLYNYMDALNYLYVAMTRAGEHLYILAPDNPPPKKGPVTYSSIGDVLHEVLSQHPQAIVDELPLRMTIKGQQTEGKSITAERSAVLIGAYRSSSLLADKLEQVEERSAERIELMEQSAAFSNTLHELMSVVRQEFEIEERVDNYTADGAIRLTDRARILAFIHTAWDHPQLGKMLRGDYRHINERSVINKYGETARPDKVLSNAEETIIIDFKSTQQTTSTQHIQQVREYRDYLVDWGYPNVRGYLYYFMHNQLVEV